MENDMSIIESAVDRARNIAADNSHGYDQTRRWGPDYDCSSLVISCFKAAGVSLTATYTGNMYSDFCSHGFSDVTASVDLVSGAGLKIGDVLLNHTSHTAIYTGEGRIVQAFSNENGGTVNGVSGDQTGREIFEGAYYNYPWDCVLRYVCADAADGGGSGNGAALWPPRELEYRAGAPLTAGADVLAAQALLKCRGYELDADGEYGPISAARAAAFQSASGLDADGIVGVNTWGALLSRGTT